MCSWHLYGQVKPFIFSGGRSGVCLLLSYFETDRRVPMTHPPGQAVAALKISGQRVARGINTYQLGYYCPKSGTVKRKAALDNGFRRAASMIRTVASLAEKTAVHVGPELLHYVEPVSRPICWPHLLAGSAAG
jgi:hypothetical protein